MTRNDLSTPTDISTNPWLRAIEKRRYLVNLSSKQYLLGSVASYVRIRYGSQSTVGLTRNRNRIKLPFPSHEVRAFYRIKSLQSDVAATNDSDGKIHVLRGSMNHSRLIPNLMRNNESDKSVKMVIAYAVENIAVLDMNSTSQRDDSFLFFWLRCWFPFVTFRFQQLLFRTSLYFRTILGSFYCPYSARPKNSDSPEILLKLVSLRHRIQTKDSSSRFALKVFASFHLVCIIGSTYKLYRFISLSHFPLR